MNSETRLTFPLDVVPKSGTMHAINEHVRWIRMPLPMSLNHINLWGLGTQDNLTLVDTGMHLDDTKNAWIDLIDKLLKYQPHISFESKGNYDEEKKYIQNKAKDNNFKILSINLVNNSQALIVTKNNNTGVLIKGFKKNELKKNYFLKNSIIEGNINEERDRKSVV